MAALIFESEARFKNGKLTVYKLPANDGGGKYEVAGICDKYHPKKAAELSSLIAEGREEEAKQQAIEYIAEMTDQVRSWSTVPCIEYIFRDMCFNRGFTGCSKIVQIACGVVADGIVGPITLAAIRKLELDIPNFARKLRNARENYEIIKVGYRANVWSGLSNRWNSVTKKAMESV